MQFDNKDKIQLVLSNAGFLFIMPHFSVDKLQQHFGKKKTYSNYTYT